MKLCTACSTRKPLAEFYRKSDSRDGRQARCAACHLETNRKMRGVKRRTQSHGEAARQLSVRVPDDLYAMLSTKSKVEKKSLSLVVTEVLDKALGLHTR